MWKSFRYFLIAPFFGCIPGEEAVESPVEKPAKKQSSGGKYLGHTEEPKPGAGNRLQKWGLALYWLFAMLYWETLVHGGMYGDFRGSFRFALGFTAGLALLIALLLGFLP